MIKNCPELSRMGALRFGKRTAALALCTLATTFVKAEFDYTYSPTLGWQLGTANPAFTVDGSGSITPAIDTVSQFLHGEFHASFGKTFTFNITTPEDGVVGLEVSGVSDSGTKVVVIRDGQTPLGQKTFSAAGTYEVDLSAGQHQIVFENTGQDWVQVTSYYFKSSEGGGGEPTSVFSGFQWTASSVAAYGKAEATFTVGRTYSNPYNSEEVKVDAIVTGPDDISYEMPAFWYQKATWPATELGGFANLTLSGDPTWMLRIAPSKPGDWTVQLRLTDGQGTSLSGVYPLTAIDSQQEGFVRRDPIEEQGYRFDSGAPYLPIGFNLAWNDHSIDGFYQAYLPKMAENGINWMRHWMTPFARQALEWDPDHWSGFYEGRGKYSQQAAAINDYALDMAAENGVYVQIALEQHGMWSASVDPMWSENPYNVANGGYLNSEGEFFTNAQAIADLKKRYRYTIARWGYSQNIFAWELFNEVNWVDATDAIKGEWHKTMSTYLKQIDPYKHLVTTSSEPAELSEYKDHPDMDILQPHYYQPNIQNFIAGRDVAIANAWAKAIIIGEYGDSTLNVSYGSESSPAHPDIWGDHVRKITWIGTMTRAPNMFWYWKEYIYPYDLFHIYKPISDFWKGQDPAAQPNLRNATLSKTGGTTGGADADLLLYGLQSDTHAYAYVIDKSYGNWAATAGTTTGVSLTIGGVPDGNWNVRYMNPLTGETTEAASVTPSSGSITLALPDFTKEIALQIATGRISYQGWRDANFSQQEILDGKGDPSAAPYGDGVPNFYKYAYGLENATDTLPLDWMPTISRTENGTLQVALRRPASQIELLIEISTNLFDWEPLETLEEAEDPWVYIDLGAEIGEEGAIFARAQPKAINSN